MDIYMMDQQSTVRKLTEEEIGTLPAFVIDTMKYGCLATHDSKLYGTSEAHVLGE